MTNVTMTVERNGKSASIKTNLFLYAIYESAVCGFWLGAGIALGKWFAKGF